MDSQNASNATNSSRGYDYTSTFLAQLDTMCAVELLICIIGTFLNLWLIVSILKSEQMRSKFRNQLICNTCVIHLFQTLIQSPIFMTLYFDFRNGLIKSIVKCQLWAAMTMLEYYNSMVSEWLMLFLAITYLLHVLECNLDIKLKPRVQTISKIGLHLVPWIVALLVVPLSVVSMSHYYQHCLYQPSDTLYVYNIAFTFVPMALSISVIITACIIRQRRFNLGSSTARGNMGIHLMGRGPEIDNVFAYAVAIVVCAICEICVIILNFDLKKLKYRGFGFQVMAICMADSRVIFLVFPWLLLPDIRERIRSWRPWKNSLPVGIDLTMAYNSHNDSN